MWRRTAGHVLSKGSLGPKGKRRIGAQPTTPTQSLPNSPLISSHFCLGVKRGHECYAWSFLNMERAILNRRKLISLLTTYDKQKVSKESMLNEHIP